MPQVIVLPHPILCEDGAIFNENSGISLCDALLKNSIFIEHACEKSCACATCHVIIREGFNEINKANEVEEDMLNKAWGLEENSRLSCQVILGSSDLTIEIPRYTINQVK
ncbi:ISC system 2Fe-2S type ferredoxin [Candidatus Profftella armatura]|uniref:ISC system 2Fe-2S type ferredoxin n=1 Tax=Candidatus Profftella armatura TaxID=669502 RepID=UPI003D989B42